MSTFHLVQDIKLPISTKFHAGVTFCSEVITISLLEAWNPVPQSKNSTRGIFELVFTFHLFQDIKLPISTKFHAGIKFCSEVITISLLEAWSLVPQSKNSTRGHFSACVHIPSFQRIKLPISTKFHAGITFCTIHVFLCANSPHY